MRSERATWTAGGSCQGRARMLLQLRALLGRQVLGVRCSRAAQRAGGTGLAHPLVPRSPRPCRGVRARVERGRLMSEVDGLAGHGWLAPQRAPRPGEAAGRAAPAVSARVPRRSRAARRAALHHPRPGMRCTAHAVHQGGAPRRCRTLARMREPSVTTMICTLWLGQLRRTCAAGCARGGWGGQTTTGSR